MDEPVRVLGCGRLAIPNAEAHSGRFGMIGLRDRRGTLISLAEVPVGINATLTATPAIEPEAERREPGRPVPKPYVLGAGAVISDSERNGGIAYLVGVRPASGRLTSWLDALTLSDIDGTRIRLELRPAITVCGCGGLRYEPLPPSVQEVQR